MNLVLIEGPRDLLQRIGDIRGLFVHQEAARRVGDEYSVPANATDDAVEEVRGRGARARVLMDNTRFEEHRARGRALVRSEPVPMPPRPEGRAIR